MRESTVQYLLTELPKIKKLFADYDAQKVSYDTMVLATIVIDLVGAITDRLDYPQRIPIDE